MRYRRQCALIIGTARIAATPVIVTTRTKSVVKQRAPVRLAARVASWEETARNVSRI